MTLTLFGAWSLLGLVSTSTVGQERPQENEVIEIPGPADERGQARRGGEGRELASDAIAPSPSMVRTSFGLDARIAVDTAFDQSGEQIATLWLGGRFDIDAQLSRNLNAYVAPKFVWVSGIDRSGDDREALYFVTPESRVTFTFGPFDLRVGALVFSWGASDLVAPIDILNPVDYRRSLFTTNEDAKIPVLAAELAVHLGRLTIRGVVEPFFTPSEFYLHGWDSSLIQPTQGPYANAATLAQLLGGPTLDQIGDKLMVNHRPSDRPDNATVAARATLGLGVADLSLTAVHGWEPLPRITINPDLGKLATAFADAISGQRPLELSAELLGALERVQSALKRGEPIFDGRYNRRDLFGADLVLPLDPFVLKLETTYTVARTYYTQDYKPISNPWWTTVLGLEYVRGEHFQAEVEAFGLAILDVRSDYRLAYLEPRAPPPSTADVGGRTLLVPGLASVVRWALLDGDLRLELGEAATLSRGDLLLMPAVHYRLDDTQVISLGGVFIEGHADAYGGVFHHNSEVYLRYRWSL